MEFYAHPRSSLTIFCSVDVCHPPQAPLQHVGRGAPPRRKSPSKCRFRFICRGRALPAIIPISRIPRKNAQKRLPSLKVAKKRLAAFCKAFVVHHRGLSRGLTKPHWGFVVGRYAKRPTRPVLVPDGAPVRRIPGNCNKKTALRFP